MGSSNTEKLVKEVGKAEQALRADRRVDAVLIYENVARRAGADPVVNAALGNLSLSFNNSSQAIGHFQTAVAADPDNPHYLGYLGRALQREGRSDEALEVYGKAMDLDDSIHQVLHGIGTIYLARQDNETAKGYLQQAVQLKPGDGAAQTNLATVLGRLNEHDAALKHAEKGLKLSPEDPVAHYRYGNILAQLGRVDEAVRHFETTTRKHKHFGDAYDYLARLKKFSAADKQFIERAEKVLQQGMPARDRLCVHYALGKIYDDCGEFDKAFGHYSQANLLQKRHEDLKRNSKELRKSLRQIKRLFDASTLRQLADHGNSSSVPVFIVGFPRSGTTLMERMIGSHPGAAGAGELPEMPRLAKQFVPTWDVPLFGRSPLRSLTPESIESAAAAYLDVLRQTARDAERVVDKLPGNYLNVWLISVLFPNATIVHSRRNPLDTCLSCYFQNFSDVLWANDLQLISGMYRFYRELMDYWRQILPDGKFIDVDYEQLVEDPEVHGKRMLQSCGLDWDEESLDFYKKKNVVRTASVWQVRQPIYTSSRRRWKNYAAHVGELAGSLSDFLQEDREELAALGIKLPN